MGPGVPAGAGPRHRQPLVQPCAQVGIAPERLGRDIDEAGERAAGEIHAANVRPLQSGRHVLAGNPRDQIAPRERRTQGLDIGGATEDTEAWICDF